MLYVNGRAIEQEWIDQEIAHLRPQYEHFIGDSLSAEEKEHQLAAWSRETVIERELLAQAAKTDTNLIAADDLQAKMESFFAQHSELDTNDPELREQLEVAIRVEALQQKILQNLSAPTEEEVRAHYEANQENYKRPELIRAAHIVKHLDGPDEFNLTKQQMDDVLAQLRNGADFEVMAMKYSDCPANGGDLGLFPRGQMVPSFEEAVFPLQLGQLSGVFHTEFGWHIAKVIDKKPAEIVPFEQAQDYIKRELVDTREKEAVEKYVDELKAGATIEERD